MVRPFAPFTQVDASATRRRDGAGLGLAISAELVSAMGGVRSVQSTVGQGSVFSFTVPLLIDRSKVDEPSRDGAGSNGEGPLALFEGLPPSPKLRVLLAEDTPTNQVLVRHALGKRGHQIEVASNGQEAVELAGENKYDVILMDLQMPDMDGFEATAAIRSLHGGYSVPIIAITAHSMVGDRERCLAAGMEGYVSKPIDLRELIEVVEATARVASTQSAKRRRT